jgi:hypothetical protein
MLLNPHHEKRTKLFRDISNPHNIRALETVYKRGYLPFSSLHPAKSKKPKPIHRQPRRTLPRHPFRRPLFNNRLLDDLRKRLVIGFTHVKPRQSES